MIGIRSVTYFLPHHYSSHNLMKIKQISYRWRSVGVFIRTQRLAITPQKEPINVQEFDSLSELCESTDVRWFNIPINPCAPNKRRELFSLARKILIEHSHSFVNILAVTNGSLDSDIIERSTDLIKRTSKISPNGMDNFRLGHSFNIRPYGPFFPFTMSDGNQGFSIALELTQEINKICIGEPKLSIESLRDLLKSELERQIGHIMIVAKKISRECGIDFFGFDFSLAPIISPDGSIVTILNRLGIYNFGKVGILFATAYLTDLLQYFSKNFPAVGFSGVMYSLLEDMELCRINNERGISVEELIPLSTMCGCGLDMVPVPGDITTSELKNIFLEVYAISTRLGKPLGIRVLPIPSSRRNQVCYTNMYNDADFVANTKVVDLDMNLIADFFEKFSFLNRYSVNMS